MHQQQPMQQWPGVPPQPPRRGVPPWAWIAGAAGAVLILVVMVAAAVASKPTSGQPSATATMATRPAASKPTKTARHHVTATEVEAVAVTAASDDGASDEAPYVTALTTLGNRCTQKPLDILTDDVLAAQYVMRQAGDNETKLSILQAMVKVSSAASDARSGHQDCEAIARALASGAGK
jgi:hypothetical protein